MSDDEVEFHKADVIKFRSTAKRHYRQELDLDDLTVLRRDLIALANRIEEYKENTPWPAWSQDVAGMMKRYARDLDPSLD